MNKISSDTVKAEFLTKGTLTANEVADRLHVSVPTALRIFRELDAIRIGNARSSSYIIPREVSTLGTSWNLYIVAEHANIERIGLLHSTSAGFYLEGNATHTAILGDEFKNGLFPALPWFLYETRLQGFIGRNIAHNLNRDFGFSKELTKWNDDTILEYHLRFGSDNPGAFILGDIARDAFLRGRDGEIAESIRKKEYPKLASSAIENGMPMSSAAGEQPKFFATIKSADGEFRNVMVKFSGHTTSPAATRWGDLLICEYLALQTLSESGFSTPRVELIFADNRVFLEYERIDRVGRSERICTSSLTSIDSAFIGGGDTSWPSAMNRAKRYFRPEDISMVERLHNFGMAIGNTDMHFGNLSFHIDRELPFRLAPIYDMLPMHYAPAGDGSLRNSPLTTIPATSETRELARKFWLSVAAHKHVSEPFKKIAQLNANNLVI